MAKTSKKATASKSKPAKVAASISDSNPIVDVDSECLYALYAMAGAFLRLFPDEEQHIGTAVGADMLKNISIILREHGVADLARSFRSSATSMTRDDDLEPALNLVEELLDHTVEILCPPSRTLADLGVE